MPLEFSDYMETRTPAGPLTGEEKFVVSQDGSGVGLTLNQILALAGISYFRGDWDGSNNSFPTTGGTGSVGVIEGGNEWNVVGEITLGGFTYADGTILKARVANPGQDLSKWRII